jgi:hypothetical protein
MTILNALKKVNRNSRVWDESPSGIAYGVFGADSLGIAS